MLPLDLVGIIINYLDKSNLLNIRSVCKLTKNAVSKRGKYFFNINSLKKFNDITNRNNKEKIFNKILFRLNLNFKNLGSKGGIAIADALKVNNSLHTLDLEDNHQGDKVTKSLEYITNKKNNFSLSI